MNISIIVSNFHRAYLFKESLRTIIPQLVPGDEIVIADDSLFDDPIVECLDPYRERVRFKHIKMNNKSYRSCCLAKNVALKNSSNPIIIINDPEVCHITPCITQIRELLENNPKLFITPGSMYFGKEEGQTMSNSSINEWGFIEHSMAPFIGGVMKKELMAVGGWDERFTFWGNDDNDLTYRLGLNGCKHETFDDMKAFHQWHQRPPKEAMGDANESLLYEKDKSIVANLNKEWGVYGK